MDSSERFDQIENLLTGIARTQDQQSEQIALLVTLARDHHEILVHHTEIFQGHTQLLHTMVERLGSIDQHLGKIEIQLEKMADYEDRIKALEQAVFRKGA